MRDANDLVKLIKKAATESVEQSKPTGLTFGKVVSSSPLQIKVDDKIVLSTAQLMLTRNVTTHTINVTMGWVSESTLTDHTHEVTGDTASGGDVAHTHGVSITTQPTNLAHTHEVKGTKSITINNALTVGESVVLMRMQGGQKYLVIDRVVNL